MWSTFIYYCHLHVYIVTGEKKGQLFCRRAECNFSGICSHPNGFEGSFDTSVLVGCNWMMVD